MRSLTVNLHLPILEGWMLYNSPSMILLPLLLGALMGLAVNYLADVLPQTRRLTRPACPACTQPIAPTDYLFGRSCQQCGRSRALRYWLVLLVMAAVSMYAWAHPPVKLGFAAGLLLLGYFGTVFVIDLEHRLILHITSLFGAILAFSLGWLAHGLTPTLIGGLGGFLIMLALYGMGALFTRLRLRRMQASGAPADDEEALGQGDVILGAILGFLLGWPLIWFGLLLGILSGGIFGLLFVLSMLGRRRYREQVLMTFMPYGPFFILGAYMIVFLPHILRLILPD